MIQTIPLIMSLEARKIELIEWLVGLTDKSILQKVAEIRTNTIDELPIINSEELQARALKSEDAIKQGNVTTFEDFKEELKTW